MDEELQREPGAPAPPPSWWQRIWTHLCVWLPPLSTPKLRKREAMYAARDYCLGGLWSISLPKQCWKSGKTDGLLPRVYELNVRAFESPIGILLGAVCVFVGSLFLAIVFPSMTGSFLVMAILGLTGGVGLLFAKSWREAVEVRFWSRPEHMDALRKPEIVIYEEVLTLVLPSDHLAEMAREEVLSQRRAAQKYLSPDAAPPAAAETAPLPNQAAPPRMEYKREQLPPIKFDE